MTKEEIIDLVAKNRVWVSQNCNSVVFEIIEFDIDINIENVAYINDYWRTSEELYIDFTYSLDLKTWHKFEVTES